KPTLFDRPDLISTVYTAAPTDSRFVAWSNIARLLRSAAAALAPVLQAAIAQWAAANVPARDLARLRGITAQIAPLPAGYLGGTALDGAVIYLSPDAAGYGWTTSPAAGPSGHEDLLTVVAHEIGHALGLYDLNPAKLSSDLMTETLAPRVRT